MAGLKLTDIQKSYGKIEVLHSIDLDVKSGEFIVFVGPSGCGKSTLLRLIAGLERITGGTLEINGQVVNDVPPASRGIAMVFQSYALYPHMTVYNNMAFGQKLAKASKEEIDKRVRAAADLLQITDYLDRLPKALSGGQRQRVAIGRAIVRDPDVFLFDEPLSNLDAALRVATRIEIAKLHERLPETTMIYVTHDQVEAMTLADRIVVLNGGYIEQVGSPLDLYERPNNLFVARFIGSPAMNIIPARLESAGSPANGGTRVTPATGATVAVPVDTSSAKAGDEVMFGIRPEDLTLANGADHVIEGTVEFTEKLGEVTLLYITNPQAGGDGAGGITEEALIAKMPGIADVARGDTVRLTADPSKIQVFSKDGQAFAH